ncbi:MAG: class I SAM-dependent methyltransferase, partial [Dehalococcoidia bacterium]|nr:class I SAM-dependent methyltransferase [Dehalococcoidia bacterium]
MNPPAPPSAPRVVIVVPGGEEVRGRAAADALGLPLAVDPSEGDLALVWDARGWALVDPAPGAPGAVRCDLVAGAFGQRLRRGVGLEERLAKAIGLRQHPGARVLDATAGLGRDSVVAALLGCTVIACERSSVV